MAHSLLVNHFRVDQVNELKYHCVEGSCNRAIAVSRSNKTYNLKRHLYCCHKKIYKSVFVKLNEYEVERLKLIQACVEFVTVNGRPLLALDDSGFQKSIESQLKRLVENGCNLAVNSRTIRPYIEHVADEIRERIKLELKNRLLSVMVDIVTKNHRGILGVNVQFYDEGKIQLRTIGMIEIHVRHTAENIKDLVIQLLSSYDVSMEQVYAYTTDNAAAMLLSGKLLNDAAGEYVHQEELLNAEAFDFDPSGQFEDIIQNVSKLIAAEYLDIQLPLITGIGCAVHILQICVNDALSGTEEELLINKVREIMKTLRNQVYMIELEARGCNLPLLDVVSRWNSRYVMVCKFLR